MDTTNNMMLSETSNLKKGPLGKLQQKKGTTSPTDNMLSPATRKIEEKRKLHLNTMKPKILLEAFSKEGVAPSAEQADGPSASEEKTVHQDSKK
ncbi:hypothetical protein BJ742DRAFT_768191 [Cladochytrium replicatum]|nr:hypothetical protein BJ742DRAFT_768191 [Cladochytrium replicatum]